MNVHERAWEKLRYCKSDESQLCLLAICVQRCLPDIIRYHNSDMPTQQIKNMYLGMKFRYFGNGMTLQA